MTIRKAWRERNLLATILVKAMRIPGFGLIPSKLANVLILSGVLRGGFFDPRKLPKDFVQELIRSGHRPGYARVETGYLRSLKSYCAARQVYSRIKAPVTLVYGDHDWSRPPEREAVARLVPGSRMLTLADTGHFASLEHPDEVARILIDATR
jgi:pimeloyl-ACP methyl ester carboxylesterase